MIAAKLLAAAVSGLLSPEGSRWPLEKAVELLTERSPLAVSARYFMTGGGGRTGVGPEGLSLVVPSEQVTVTASVVIVYEIPPAERHLLMGFLSPLPTSGLRSLGVDPGAWSDATDKRRMVKCFPRDGIPHMKTIVLSASNPGAAWGPSADWFRTCGVAESIIHVTRAGRVVGGSVG